MDNWTAGLGNFLKIATALKRYIIGLATATQGMPVKLCLGGVS